MICVIPSSEILQEIFIWNLFIKHSHNDKVGWRDLHAGHRTVILRTSDGVRPMIPRWSYDVCSIVADFRTEARRTPAERRPISWQYFGTHRLGHRAMSVRTSYNVRPMPRIPDSSSPMPSRCADIGNIGRDIVRPPVDLWPWHYDPHCPWHWAPFPVGFLEIRKFYRQFAEIRSMPQESKWKVTELYEKSSRHYQNLHFQIPWFFPYGNHNSMIFPREHFSKNSMILLLDEHRNFNSLQSPKINWIELTFCYWFIIPSLWITFFMYLHFYHLHVCVLPHTPNVSFSPLSACVTPLTSCTVGSEIPDFTFCHCTVFVALPWLIYLSYISVALFWWCTIVNWASP